MLTDGEVAETLVTSREVEETILLAHWNMYQLGKVQIACASGENKIGGQWLQWNHMTSNHFVDQWYLLF